MLLSKNLHIDESELLEHLIAGIANLQLRNQAKMQCFKSSEELLRSFSNLELPQTYMGNAANVGVSRLVKQVIRFYNCNCMGHYAGECSKPKREPGACYGRESLSLRVNVCPERKMVHIVGESDYVRSLKLYVSEIFYFCLSCLIDSGSPISFVKEKCVTKTVKILKCNETYFGLNKSPLKIVGKILCSVKKQENCLFNFIVVTNDSMRHEAVVGRDLMNLLGMKLLFEETAIIIKCIAVEIDRQKNVEND